jgi:murein L,D-transpeptidase YcbB/YkuD
MKHGRVEMLNIRLISIIFISTFLIIQPYTLSADEIANTAESNAVTAKDTIKAPETNVVLEKKPQAKKPDGFNGLVYDILKGPNKKFAHFLDIDSDDIVDFYRLRGYSPIWLADNRWNQKAQQAIDTLFNAEIEGLSPQDYDIAHIKTDISNIKSNELAKAEIQLTTAIMQYIVDAKYGRRELQLIDSARYKKTKTPHPDRLLRKGISKSDFKSWLQSLPPQRPEYQRLKQLLATLRNQANDNNKIRKITLNMERWRWLPKKHTKRYIIVNIAGFNLMAFENDKMLFKTKVIVGNEYRQTPVFSAPMTSLKFNPTWTVPRSIARRDIIPQIRQNPKRIFGAYGMRVIGKGGADINPYSINWQQVSARSFPYRFKQRPGPMNALGKLRFSIVNPYAIFLHDTPTKNKFNSNVRTLSSGCIRVQDPPRLAEFCFNDPKWSAQRIANNMKGTNTHVVTLASPVDVDMMYATVWVGPDGVAHYYNDVYNRDRNMMRVLGLIRK